MFPMLKIGLAFEKLDITSCITSSRLLFVLRTSSSLAIQRLWILAAMLGCRAELYSLMSDPKYHSLETYLRLYSEASGQLA